jgi:hypothetical protein
VSLFWKEWKTGTVGFEQFLHEPLAIIRENFGGVDDGWTVSTQVVNHQHGLSNSTSCTLLILMPNYRSALITLYKHGPGE